MFKLNNNNETKNKKKIHLKIPSCARRNYVSHKYEH